MLYYIDEATEADFEEARKNPKSPQNYGFDKICVSSLYKKKVKTLFNLIEK